MPVVKFDQLLDNIVRAGVDVCLSFPRLYPLLSPIVQHESFKVYSQPSNYKKQIYIVICHYCHVMLCVFWGGGFYIDLYLFFGPCSSLISSCLVVLVTIMPLLFSIIVHLLMYCATSCSLFPSSFPLCIIALSFQW